MNRFFYKRQNKKNANEKTTLLYKTNLPKSRDLNLRIACAKEKTAPTNLTQPKPDLKRGKNKAEQKT